MSDTFVLAYFDKIWEINRKCDDSNFTLGETKTLQDEAAPTLPGRVSVLTCLPIHCPFLGFYSLFTQAQTLDSSSDAL